MSTIASGTVGGGNGGAKLLIEKVKCVNLEKCGDPISTGIGFLNHMIDQLNSHAQVGVSIVVTLAENGGEEEKRGDEEKKEDKLSEVNFLADNDGMQELVLRKVGEALGTELRTLLLAEASTRPSTTGQGAWRSRFCCPLDEALAECLLVFRSDETAAAGAAGTVPVYELAPFGIFGGEGGRRHVGSLATRHIRTFFEGLASASGLSISLRKLRGHNAHHIVESTFKAFSRALRNLLDGTDTGEMIQAATNHLWGPSSESWQQSLALQRTATLERKTKETTISVQLQMDGGAGQVQVDVGIPTLNRFWSTLFGESRFLSAQLHCQGDVWIDDHHTAEDVAIAVGQCLHQAWGTKAGLNRMWSATARVNDSVVEVVMDLSNRPCLTHNLSLTKFCDEYVDPSAEAPLLSVEMLDHVLESLVTNAKMTAHIVEVQAGASLLDLTLAVATAFGQCLCLCSTVDPRRAGKIASSKGTLSV